MDERVKKYLVRGIHFYLELCYLNLPCRQHIFVMRLQDFLARHSTTVFFVVRCAQIVETFRKKRHFSNKL